MPSERTNNFPESVRGLGHVAPTILIDFVDVRTVRWPAPNIGRYLVRKKTFCFRHTKENKQTLLLLRI